MNKTARQMCQALLMSEDLETGTLMYEILTDKKKPEVVLATEKDLSKKAFLQAVFNGEYENALSMSNGDNAEALKRYKTLQKFQSLLACNHRQTAALAYKVLSGRLSFEQAKKETSDEYLLALLNLEDNAEKKASVYHLDALLAKSSPDLDFKLNTLQNLHRLNYIIFDQKLTLDEVINTMIKAFYETIRADDYAELLGDDQPQNFLI